MSPPARRASFPEGRTAVAIGLVALLLAVVDVVSQYHPNTWIQRDGRFGGNGFWNPYGFGPARHRAHRRG